MRTAPQKIRAKTSGMFPHIFDVQQSYPRKSPRYQKISGGFIRISMRLAL
jgi:hypothetical protein